MAIQRSGSRMSSSPDRLTRNFTSPRYRVVRSATVLSDGFRRDAAMKH